eukprot:1157596-Pelagomonas_calceolata.AAC.5
MACSSADTSTAFPPCSPISTMACSPADTTMAFPPCSPFSTMACSPADTTMACSGGTLAWSAAGIRLRPMLLGSGAAASWAS